MTPLTFKRPQHAHFWHNNFCSHNIFGGNGSKYAFNNTGPWGQPKDAKVSFKSLVKSAMFDKGAKRERSSSDSMNYDSWNTTKKRLYDKEFDKRCRSANACISRGEVSHMFNDFPKPKPWLLESIVDFAAPMARTPISELPSLIDEPCVINLKIDYLIVSIEHQLNYARVIRRKVDFTSNKNRGVTESKFAPKITYGW